MYVGGRVFIALVQQQHTCTEMMILGQRALCRIGYLAPLLWRSSATGELPRMSDRPPCRGLDSIGTTSSHHFKICLLRISTRILSSTLRPTVLYNLSRPPCLDDT